MAVISIYKRYASGGRELGRLLAKNLGYQYVDKSLFQEIAEALHVSEGTLASFEQSRQYRISNTFSNLFSKSYIQRIVGYDKSVVEEKEYQNSLEKLVLAVAEEDNAVIIGRASHYFLRDRKNCLRFRLVAPMDFRLRYAVDKLGISPAQAQSVVEGRDRNHQWFQRSVCGDNYDSPLLFHLTINTGFISIEKTADIILSLVGSTKK
ncbi:MAG: cytidylate kinase-like family protein [Deltaproteobacteria bacterium]|nr:cytidylate kinase-like family protein [Deltaproteobacteria bacterium]